MRMRNAQNAHFPGHVYTTDLPGNQIGSKQAYLGGFLSRLRICLEGVCPPWARAATQPKGVCTEAYARSALRARCGKHFQQRQRRCMLILLRAFVLGLGQQQQVAPLWACTLRKDVRMVRFIRFYLMWRAIKIVESVIHFVAGFIKMFMRWLAEFFCTIPQYLLRKPCRAKVQRAFLFCFPLNCRGLRSIMLVVLISTHPHFTCHKSTFPAKSRVVLVPSEKTRSFQEEVWSVATDTVSSKVLKWSLLCGAKLKHWSGWRRCQRCGHCQSLQT